MASEGGSGILPGLAVVPELDLPSHQHMALDEVLLDAVAAGGRGPLLRFWGWTQPTLVLGSNQAVSNELDLEAVARHGFTVTRRISGGGTMLAEPGRTITWSLVIPAAAVAGMSFVESFAHLDRFAVAALRGLGIEAAYRPINDIISPAGKISGAAQARRKGALLQHTTMAYSMRAELMTELIRIGRPALSDRGVRSAEKRVSPVATLGPHSRPAVVAALIAAAGGTPGSLSSAELASAALLATKKYSKQEWIYRLP